MSNKVVKTLTLALGAAFLSSVAVANAAQFQLNDLGQGYMLTGEEKPEGSCGGDKGKEGNCGEDKDKTKEGEEGKCGEGKCGEGKCGGEKEKAKEGSCGGSH